MNREGSIPIHRWSVSSVSFSQRESCTGCPSVAVHAWSGMDSAEWDEDGGRINKTLRFCRRCIDVVFILSSLMSTCELDRFVIQTPYIKVVKSCSAPFVDRGRGHGRTNGGGTNATRTDGRTDGRGTLPLFLVPASPVTQPIDR